MNHLVLGSKGQIGWHLVRYLNRKGEEVCKMDIKRSDYEDLRINKNEILYEKAETSDFIHFLAFDIGGSKYMKNYQDSYEFIKNNVQIMDNVFGVIDETDTPFIFASSQMSEMDFSTYGQLKKIGEKYTNALDGIIVKFWNVYGKEEVGEKSHVVTDFLKKAKDDGMIKMLTDGSEERQFLYGDDAAECLYTISEKYNNIDRNEDIHITSFEWTKIIDLAKMISNKYGSGKVVPSESSEDDIQKGVKNEPSEYVLNFWQPSTSLEEGVEKVDDITSV
ncbi:nucleoside-diphosphate-sugar epimerase [Salinibacter ruber]|uniref:NAD-dependent epimerase/dehydratase family protein n=1 Tax=Salinibacter ruber TaxID=146919 RepID=UPI00216A49E0|nr:NAD(P)-dependent oxidoreductase [Salinibacter ruber]MCS3830043.1 nucleoside-diphosphate-sugar epimerase [Salinibacter ruber]